MLRALLVPSSPAPFQLERVARVLAAHAPLCWAGLVEWHQRELDGTLVGEWGDDSARPTLTALTSWFVREVDVDDGLVRVSGSELGRDGVYVAVPLGDEGSVAGFLVLALERSMPRRVELALLESLDVLARVLLPRPATHDEDRELVLVQPVRAAASG